jgi:hypothetical protein
MKTTAKGRRARSQATSHNAYSVDAGELSQFNAPMARAARPTPAMSECTISIDSIVRSPYQPIGRPSAAAVQAVQAAITAAGSLAMLMDAAGASPLTALTTEAQALAQLAADIELHGIEVPLEVRRVEGGYELLSGHRRLVAARVAGLQRVPIRDHGAVSDEEAIEIVVRRNEFRAEWQTWHRVVLLVRKKAQRESRRQPTSLRALGAVMGYSHTFVSTLLKIAAADSMGQRNRDSKRAAGVSKSSVLRGRAFSLAAT